jgi:glycosyltransferase involved in cell wall biosynthesis
MPTPEELFMCDEFPLVSICIPTYNRASFLEETLRDIVEQEIFQESYLVEIVVSDNCSSDNTPQVISVFQERFPEKIRAARTEQLVHSSINFARVLEMGRGQLRKLHNDTLRVNGDFLEQLVWLVKKERESRPFVFFLNGNRLVSCAQDRTHCSDLDAFISHISFYSTWIGGFSLWDTDVPRYTSFFREAAHHFAQTEILFAAMTEGRDAIVFNLKFGESALPAKNWTKDSIREVYFAEYLPIVHKYSQTGHIKYTTEKREIRRFCLSFYIPYYYALTGRTFVGTFYKDFVFIRNYTGLLFYIFSHMYYVAYCLLYGVIKDKKYKITVMKLKNILYR